ncbi:MAG TPA: META domain-containing protein [Steroidobacteraceae bacterium]|nr:META domain-containing protein [Steroidobacteraceae bacterium]
MRAFSVLMLSMALAACTTELLAMQPGTSRPPEGHASISVTVSYGAQTPPPAGAELHLSLEDVSRADAPAHVISATSVSSSLSSPLEFEITYDPSVIIANHRYVVRARVMKDGAELFVSDKAYPVLGAANITHLHVLMRRASAATSPASDQSTAQLENTYWKLMTLGDEKVASPAGAREIHFVMQSEGHRVHGFAGCNGMMGSYTLNATRLAFSQMGGTMMACTNGMELEQKFHQVFPRVAAWKIEGESLQLLDAAGTVLATFESRYLR